MGSIILVICLVLVVYGLSHLRTTLAVNPESRISKLAFTRFGPIGCGGEHYSEYLLRWMSFSSRWLWSIVILWLLLFFSAKWTPEIQESDIRSILLGVVLPTGIGMALLATVGFALRYLKARFLGPNLICYE